MEKTISVKEVKEFQFGSNKEKTGYNIIDKEDIQFTTFSKTVADEAKAAMLDEKERKVEFIEKPNTNPAYPPMRTITTFSNENGEPIEQPKKAYGGGGGRSPKDTESIEHQVALKCAVEYGTAMKKTEDQIIEIAGLFTDFLDHRRTK